MRFREKAVRGGDTYELYSEACTRAWIRMPRRRESTAGLAAWRGPERGAPAMKEVRAKPRVRR